MKFSIFLQPLSPTPTDDHRVMNEVLNQCVLAEDLGFDGVFLAEHNFTGEAVFGEPIVFATAIAMKTKRIEIGFAVLQLALHHPVRTAIQLANLDHLSNGRLRVGVARGSTFNEWEYRGFGLTSQQGRERFEETLDLLVKTWTANDLDYKGKYWDVFVPAMRPTTYQQPHPEIYRAAITPESTRKIGLDGGPIMFPRLHGETIHELLAVYESSLREGGVKDDRVRYLLHEASFTKSVYVAPTDDEAWDQIAGPTDLQREHITHNKSTYGGINSPEAVAYSRGESNDPQLATSVDPRVARYSPIMQRGLVVGSPETVLEQLRGLRGYGLQHVLAAMNWGAMPNELVERSMRLFATEVMPALHAEFPAPNLVPA